MKLEAPDGLSDTGGPGGDSSPIGVGGGLRDAFPQFSILALSRNRKAPVRREDEERATVLAVSEGTPGSFRPALGGACKSSKAPDADRVTLISRPPVPCRTPGAKGGDPTQGTRVAPAVKGLV